MQIKDVMATEVCAVASYGGYTVSVREDDNIETGEEIDGEPIYTSGYVLAVADGAMSPHASHDFRTLDEVVAYIASGEVLGMPADYDGWEPCED